MNEDERIGNIKSTHNVMGYYRIRYNNPFIQEIEIASMGEKQYKLLCCPIDLEQLIMEHRRFYKNETDPIRKEKEQTRFISYFGFFPDDIIAVDSKENVSKKAIRNTLDKKNIRFNFNDVGYNYFLLNPNPRIILIKRNSHTKKIQNGNS